MEASIAAVICAAGSSSRMGGKKKEFLPFGPGGLTVLGASVRAFASSPKIGPIVVTVPAGGEAAARASLPAECDGKENSVHFVTGGGTRRASVFNALKFLETFAPSHVLIHDGARPWIKADLIERVLDAALAYGAVIPALPLVETPKELDRALIAHNAFDGSSRGGGTAFIKRHLRRAELCTAQTPQGFAFPELLAAHENARERETGENFEYTDDAEVWGEFTGKVAVIPGDPGNKKITFPEDLAPC